MKKYKSIKIVEKSTAEDFLNYLNPRRSHWGNTSDLPWIFRGQKKSTWSLQPRAWRKDGQLFLKSIYKKLRPYVEFEYDQSLCHFTELKKIKKKIAIEGFLQSAAEYESTWQFANLADELGYPVFEHDRLMSGEDFIKTHNVDHKWYPLNIPLAFCLSQHHGIPTRLLDWTYNSMVAAYFAAEKHNSNCDKISVWAINSKFLKIHNCLKVQTCPRHQHSFLHAQSGLFLYYEKANEYYYKNEQWPIFEDIIESKFNDNENIPIIKIDLRATESNEVLRLLWKERITKAHLMPIHDTITKTIQLKWELF